MIVAAGRQARQGDDGCKRQNARVILMTYTSFFEVDRHVCDSLPAKCNALLDNASLLQRVS